MTRRALAAAAVTLGLLPVPAAAQFGLTNLAEMRAGDERFSRFDQLRLDFRRDMLRLGLRYESYVPSDDSAFECSGFVRRYAGWSQRGFDAVVGNYEAIFGRGLVLRAFELPAVIREERATCQFGDSRDLDGVRFDVHGRRYALTVLQGKPRRADEPPDVPRRGSVEGATAGFQVAPGIRAGGHYLRRDKQSPGAGARAEVGAGYVQLALGRWLERAGLERLALDTYVEYARAGGLDPSEGRSPKVEPDRGYGFYGSQGFIVDDVVPGLSFGASYEYKDYQNFQLLVNEPPALVREHAFALLNRSTHVLQPVQEEGYQFESRLDYRQVVDLTLNWSRAENVDSRRFHERYVELAAQVRGARLTVFSDSQSDGTDDIAGRDTWGGYALVPVAGPHAVEIEAETQDVVRQSRSARSDFEDRYLSLGWSWAGRASLAFVRQTTNDPDEATTPETDVVRRRAYDAITGTAPIGSHHELTLFWGRRRGGRACVAGTCYDVLGFDGVLARLITRF